MLQKKNTHKLNSNRANLKKATLSMDRLAHNESLNFDNFCLQANVLGGGPSYSHNLITLDLSNGEYV